MKKAGLLFVLAAMAALGLPRNQMGWGDTASITDTLQADTIKYTAALSLTDGENIRVLCKVDDTTSAGFASDSISFVFGYQTGTITLDSTTDTSLADSYKLDTMWCERVILDTFSVDSFNVDSVWTTGTDGAITSYANHPDTAHVEGWAVISRCFYPEWDEIIRYWAKGLAANKAGEKLRGPLFEQHRRRGLNTQ